MKGRNKEQKVVTQRILIIVVCSMVVFAAVACIMLIELCSFVGTFALVWNCGMLGGAVSLQQRLRNAESDEVDALSSSWPSLLMVPVIGGVFAFLLCILFMSEILDVSLFPKFMDQDCTANARDNLVAFIFKTGPVSTGGTAKLLFWSFVAGFSERFVPQIVRSVSKRALKEAGEGHGRDADGERKRPVAARTRPRRATPRYMLVSGRRKAAGTG